MNNLENGKDIWEITWGKSVFGDYLGIEENLAINKKMDLLFNKYLDKGNKKILEIGCAKAKKLIYFSKRFGYSIYGLDYSEQGVRLAKKNLQFANIEGTIRCENVFDTSFGDESFDIVYSLGVIEHFDDINNIISAHIKLLKKTGTLIITVPNFKYTLYFYMSKLFGKDKKLLEEHNLDAMDKILLEKIAKDLKLNILYLDYFGPIDLMLVPYGVKNKNLLILMHILNQIISYSTFVLPLPKFLSPYLVLIAEK